MTDEDIREALLGRLVRKAQLAPMMGGGSISADGRFTSYVTDTGLRDVNPDGPAAAAEIASLFAKLRIAREALEALTDILYVQEHDDGLMAGKTVLWGGPKGSQLCLHIVGNSYSAATVGQIASRLISARALLEQDDRGVLK